MRAERLTAVRLTVAALALAAAAGWPAAGSARPLELSEIQSLGAHLACVSACPALPEPPLYTDHAARARCLAACGTAPRAWEKDGVPGLTVDDERLALLELFAAAEQPPDGDTPPPDGPLICYRDPGADTIVVPAPLCAGAPCEVAASCTEADCAAPVVRDLDCTDDDPGGPRCWYPDGTRPPYCTDTICAAHPARSAEACEDADGDGLPAWLETYLGRDGASADRLCDSLHPCAFDQRCAFSSDLGTGECVPRDCRGACTAFHLERVALDDHEVIVHVHYDFTPIPARVLDLHVQYDPAALTLRDARALAPLALAGKSLTSTHLASGVLRLTVLDGAGTSAIPAGPIVELVFARHTAGSSRVAFVGDDALQSRSVAPRQGDAATQAALGDDLLWGAPVDVPARDQISTRLRLWYTFESVAEPLAFAAVPGAHALCERVAGCANEDDAAARANLLARLGALQAGSLFGGVSVDGVSGNAVYLDGGGDHLRLPVQYETPLTATAQSFSWQTWFAGEGNSADERKDTPQLLYSHNGFDERTAFAVLLQPDGNGTQRLAFSRGDVLAAQGASSTTIASGIALRTWHHVGFTLDATTGHVDLYFDGERAASVELTQPPTLVQCPQFQAGTDVLLHDEGNVLGGRAPEDLFLGVRAAGLYQIERRGSEGLTREVVLAEGDASFRDPDYSPLVDRLVFSSSRTGSFEIWLADGDGSNARQLTFGFGDAARGIAARRPRWAPDASGVVFESNVYDVTQHDNAFDRVTHLYFIGYDALANQVEIDVPGSAPLDSLDYPALLASQTISSHRVTGASQDRHHLNAQWLRGRDRAAGTRGVLLIDSTGVRFDGRRIERLTLDDVAELSTLEPVDGLGVAGEEVRLLAARRSVRPAAPDPIVRERVFFERSSVVVSPDAQFLVVPSESADGATSDVTVEYAPDGYADDCWDRNRDRLQDADEDRNGDGLVDGADCLPHEVRGLYVEFDAEVWQPVLEDADGNAQTPGAILAGGDKSLRLEVEYPDGRAFVRVEARSPLDATPLTAGTLVVLRFARVSDDAPTVDFGAFARASSDAWFVKDLDDFAEPQPLDPAGVFEEVLGAAFDPDGDRLAIVATSHARPVLLRTDGVRTADGAESLLLTPTALAGLSWTRQARFYPCNWVGGYLHPQAKSVVDGFRGALDELKLHAGLVDPDAFRSEAERGHELLAALGQDGPRPSRLPSCGVSNADCPPYHLCIESECRMIPCDPGDAYACSATGGRCTLRPAAVEQEYTGRGGQPLYDWVCAADCQVDAQCFTQACLNGPCRFCDVATLSCEECRETVRQLGSLTVAAVEGCPDERSFACVAGACVSSCYSFQDGQTTYLCDPALEYCERGRCVLHDWSWWDLAPATFGGAGEMLQRVAPDPASGWNGYTQSVDQRVPIVLTAYGVADYLQSPEVVVEVKGGPFYASDWHRVGTVMVHARTRSEAQAGPVTLVIPHPFGAMRLRLVTTPYHNLDGAAAGMLSHDKDFCLADAEASGADASACYRRAQGSRFTLGYPVGIPQAQVIAGCRDQGRAGCPVVANGELEYLSGGQPAVIVLGVEVDGASAMNNITANTVCAYGGYGADGLVPNDGGAEKTLLYGAVSSQQSNDREAFCAANPDVCDADGQGLLEFDARGRGFGLLNCNVYDPSNGGELARIELSNIVIVKEWPARAGAIVLDDGDTCTVEVGGGGTAPCYAWTGGGDPSIDAYAAAVDIGGTVPFGALDFGLFRSFGHDEGFTRVPLPTFVLSAVVSAPEGLLLTGLELVNGDASAEPTAAGGVTIDGAVKLGARYDVSVAAQPADPSVSCAVCGDGAGVMQEGGASVSAACEVERLLGGTVAGASGELRLAIDSVPTDACGAPGELTRAFLSLRASEATFAYGDGLLPGSTYTVSVVRSPPTQYCAVQDGSGVVGLADVTGPAVVCSSVPYRTLSVFVSGLEGAGLRVVDAVSRQALDLDADGLAAFGAAVPEGSSYAVAVTVQPSDPRQQCAVTAGGSGAVGTEDVLAATIVCTTLPTYALGGQVLGLVGTALRLTLNGTETLELAHGDPNGAVVPFEFSTRLNAGDSYVVAVGQDPIDPAETCSVAAGSGTMTDADESGVLVLCAPVPDTSTFVIGGTVSGLQGKGLRLSYNSSAMLLDVTENGSFTFPARVGDLGDYTITVERQPSSPPQTCKVRNGDGRIDGADVTNVAITCASAINPTVQITDAAAPLSSVRLRLYDKGANGELRADSASGARLDLSGGVIATLTEPGTSDEPATIDPGDYYLYVWVDLDRDGSYTASDIGVAEEVNVPTSGTAAFSVVASDLLALVQVQVVAGLVADPTASMYCHWSTPDTAPIPQPYDTYVDPVVGTSQEVCPGGPCVIGQTIRTLSNDALPQGLSYDLTCSVGASPFTVYGYRGMTLDGSSITISF